jgi:hypothetical protein
MNGDTIPGAEAMTGRWRPLSVIRRLGECDVTLVIFLRPHGRPDHVVKEAMRSLVSPAHSAFLRSLMETTRFAADSAMLMIG